MRTFLIAGLASAVVAEVPTCKAHKGTVWALCGTHEVKMWGVGPEGEAQAIKNCNFASTNKQKFGTCAAQTSSTWNGVPVSASAWRDEVTSLGVTHEKVETGKVGSQYNSDGMFLPPLNTPYNVGASKTCCAAKCANQDCQMGCDMWLHSSSLNWESMKWWPVLQKKCQRDCVQGLLWKQKDATGVHIGMVGHRAARHASTQIAKSYWTSLKLHPNDISQCQVGCSHYYDCMGVDSTR